MKYMKVVTLSDGVSTQHANHDMRQKQLAAAAAAGYLHYPRGRHELCEENLFTNDAPCLARKKYHAQPRIIRIATRPPARALTLAALVMRYFISCRFSRCRSLRRALSRRTGKACVMMFEHHVRSTIHSVCCSNRLSRSASFEL
jgi:hypothetical protein